MVNYIACDFFTTRLPILSLNNYFEVFNKSTKIEIKNKLFTLFEEELLKELLAIASLDSYQAINRLASSDSYKENKQILSTLLKYYIRLSTRPTPYGAFSGLAIGNFAKILIFMFLKFPIIQRGLVLIWNGYMVLFEKSS